jgi:hypothetical protein
VSSHDSFGPLPDRHAPNVSITALRTLLHPSFWPEIVTAAEHQHNTSATVIDDNDAANTGANAGSRDDEDNHSTENNT